MPSADDIELRQMIPRKVADVLDGVSLARGSGFTRTQLVSEILLEYAKRKVHEATVVCRTSGINPAESDSGWSGLS